FEHFDVELIRRQCARGRAYKLGQQRDGETGVGSNEERDVVRGGVELNIQTRRVTSGPYHENPPGLATGQQVCCGCPAPGEVDGDVSIDERGLQIAADGNSEAGDSCDFARVASNDRTRRGRDGSDYSKSSLECSSPARSTHQGLPHAAGDPDDDDP